MVWSEFASRGGDPVQNFRAYLVATINGIPNDTVKMPGVERRDAGRVDLVAAGTLENGARVAVGTIVTPETNGVFVDIVKPDWGLGPAFFVPNDDDTAYNRVGVKCTGNLQEAVSLFDSIGKVVDSVKFDVATTAAYAKMLVDPTKSIGVFLPQL